MEENHEAPRSRAFDPSDDWAEQVRAGIMVPGAILDCLAAGCIIGLVVGAAIGAALVAFWPYPGS